jgi:hemerythrin-like metal-binding protein
MYTSDGMASSPNCKEKLEMFSDQNKKIMDIYKKHMEIRGSGTGNYLPVIRELIVYMTQTFHDENILMMQTNYPAFMEHAKSHQQFMKTVEEFLLDYERGDRDLGFKIFVFLKEWIRDHISKLDADCAIYLRNNGINVSKSASELDPFEDAFLAIPAMV